jgi:hypothetical protein
MMRKTDAGVLKRSQQNTAVCQRVQWATTACTADCVDCNQIFRAWQVTVCIWFRVNKLNSSGQTGAVHQPTVAPHSTYTAVCRLNILKSHHCLFVYHLVATSHGFQNSFFLFINFSAFLS